MTRAIVQNHARRSNAERKSRMLSMRGFEAMRSHQRKPEEGGLLIEVLVGMFILVLVFTATSITLSSMANIRVQIEQRDRALALASSYEELSRTFRCGFIIDRIADSLSTNPASSGQGMTDFMNNVKACDFKAQALGITEENGGDQDFDKIEKINETNSKQVFHVKIRYWWEDSEQHKQQLTCSDISSSSREYLPAVMTRAINVSWKERGVDRDISIIKRDPVPTDNVVFASGSRANLLIKRNTAILDNEWIVRMYPYGLSGMYIERKLDREPSRLKGQPTQCVWFAYLTQEASDNREVKIFENGAASTASNIAIDTVGSQQFKVSL